MTVSGDYLYFLFFSPAAIFILHIFTARMIRLVKPDLSPLHVAAFVILAAFGILGAFAWDFYLSAVPDMPARFWACLFGTFVYGGLAFSYFQLFAMTETARRIHILRKLYFEKKIGLEQLRREYGSETMLSVRLARMVQLGQLEVKNGRYAVRGLLILRVAKVMAFWSTLLGFSGEK